MKSQTATLCVLVLMCVLTQAVLSWAMESPRLYTCCCPACGHKSNGVRLPKCFPCRRTVHYCNCDSCSCFPPEPKIETSDEDAANFLQMLMRGGFTSRRTGKRGLPLYEYED